MDLEELILLYYLKVFSIFITILFIFYSSLTLIIINKDIKLYTNYISINKGQDVESILNKHISNYNNIEIYLIKNYTYLSKIFFKNFIHYGEFQIDNNTNFIKFFKIISQPSNILEKLTIIEGWSKYQLDKELSKYYKKYYPISYENIIADTYFINKRKDFQFFTNKLENVKNKYFAKHQNNKLLQDYSIDEIMIIGSLIEKEGLGHLDKKKISSVIFNRLNNNMKLQIDATVLFAITNGTYRLDRELLLSDLKIDHPYNTYLYKGLPPSPISYVGKKTLDIIFENYSTDFLFYFFDNSLKKHIFSKSFKEHKEKLNEYRIKQ